MMMKMLPTVSKSYITQTRWLFHCHFKIKIPFECGEQTLNDCFELLSAIDRKYNSYQAGSYFDQINQQAGSWVTVDDACIQMLKSLLLVSRFTEGSFDVSCMPLLRLWGFYRQKQDDIPTEKAINESLQHVDYRKIAVSGNDVKIQPTQELITGSFIKAFATDQVVQLLQKRGVTDAIINAGGSTIMGLNNDMHRTWKVNVPDPHSPNKIAKSISINNQCFSLSARSNNNLVINGKEYGHIISPKTGWPVSTLQVGVLSKNAFIGDILSTALFALEKNEVEESVNKLRRYVDFDYFRIDVNDKNN
ncbi:FAD:protein FMN transferase [Sphingobacterium sp. lm-10]|uniref:FAD:protein FMN transferase n=1 Tax=Sphingobacterium sp. lm-10 TaxID=2944904 RepID=UPI00201FB99D|nr:FAD:protein FMN transferase [Sphingobacterium sp. lm-10]MCL7986713.1 FAD:protein FMN transferase [Sphingobacterium sp. lm-10]